MEYDIGKLQNLGISIKCLSRDDKYRLLTTDPDQMSYPLHVHVHQVLYAVSE